MRVDNPTSTFLHKIPPPAWHSGKDVSPFRVTYAVGEQYCSTEIVNEELSEMDIQIYTAEVMLLPPSSTWMGKLLLVQNASNFCKGFNSRASSEVHRMRGNRSKICRKNTGSRCTIPCLYRHGLKVGPRLPAISVWSCPAVAYQNISTIE